MDIGLTRLWVGIRSGEVQNVPRNFRQRACYAQSEGVVTDTHWFSTTVRKKVTEFILSLLFADVYITFRVMI